MTTAEAAPPLAVPSADRALEDEAGVEFVNGKIVEKPVSIESSMIEGMIHGLLWQNARETRSAYVFTSTMGYRCYPQDPLKFRKPDVSVIHAERMRAIDPAEGFMPVPADLVVEVISPNDLFYDVLAKVDEYLQNGFGLVWVVNPPTRTVQIYRADGSVARLREGDEITGENALPSFQCKVAVFFNSPENAQPGPR